MSELQTIQDRERVALWLRTRTSLREVLDTPAWGLVDNRRFSPKAVRAYSLIYKWSSFKFSEKYPDTMSYAAIMRRVSRCHKLVTKYYGVTLP